jgi:hypothetical protein
VTDEMSLSKSFREIAKRTLKKLSNSVSRGKMKSHVATILFTTRLLALLSPSINDLVWVVRANKNVFVDMTRLLVCIRAKFAHLPLTAIMTRQVHII